MSSTELNPEFIQLIVEHLLVEHDVQTRKEFRNAFQSAETFTQEVTRRLGAEFSNELKLQIRSLYQTQLSGFSKHDKLLTATDDWVFVSPKSMETLDEEALQIRQSRILPQMPDVMSQMSEVLPEMPDVMSQMSEVLPEMPRLPEMPKIPSFRNFVASFVTAKY